VKNFHDLFRHELRDIYSAEIQIDKLLPEFAKAASSKELRAAFLKHHEETKEQIERLEEIAGELNVNLEGRECEAMKIFAREAQKVIQADYPHEVKDAALISCAQRIEHYEITLYGTLKAFAHHLGLRDIEKLLDMTSKEEGHADKKLTEIAIGSVFNKGINEKAMRKTA
jgi:Uncharacterized protein conserved in bacteria